MNAERRHSRPEPNYGTKDALTSMKKKASSGNCGPTKAVFDQFGEKLGKKKMGEKCGARKKWGK